MPALTAPLLCSEIDFTLVSLETLARVFDPPTSPPSPAREQVSLLWVGTPPGEWPGDKWGLIPAPSPGHSCFHCRP